MVSSGTSIQPRKPLIITLDGPAGSGKSTVARRLAQRLGLEFLDTGAMYRGITAEVLDERLDPIAQRDAVVDLAHHMLVRFDWNTDPPRLHVNGRDLTHRLRDPDVTSRVSDIAAMPEIRRLMVHAQQSIGREHPRLVTEGRDQGSVVFPGAQVKFYVDAAAKVRAHRRAAQLREMGRDANESEILEQIIARDHRDAHRADGPLIKPTDAVMVDTSSMTLDEVLDHLEREVRARVRGDVLEESAPAERAR
jgi:cytidylate kinase